VVLFDGSVGSVVVGLGCGVTEHRGAAVDSVAGVRECAGYSSGGIGREVSSSAWRARATWPIAWRARGTAATRGTGSGGALVRSGQHGRKMPDCLNPTGPGPIQCTVLFCNYSHFAPISKYKVKTIPMSKIIETWHGARVDPSKQFLPSGPLLILNRIQVIKLGTTPL
jgi:hypothetical protein